MTRSQFKILIIVFLSPFYVYSTNLFNIKFGIDKQGDTLSIYKENREYILIYKRASSLEYYKIHVDSCSTNGIYNPSQYVSITLDKKDSLGSGFIINRCDNMVSLPDLHIEYSKNSKVLRNYPFVDTSVYIKNFILKFDIEQLSKFSFNIDTDNTLVTICSSKPKISIILNEGTIEIMNYQNERYGSILKNVFYIKKYQ